jgi:uncharacterized surface protein with fasciclin (FAS1) repeats
MHIARRLGLLVLTMLFIGILPATAQEDGTIVDVAGGDSDFDTLVAAIDAANLVETFSGEGPYTVFAPTDASINTALEAMKMDAEELLADPEVLEDILTYHVVEGIVTAADLTEGAVETLSGETLQIDLTDDGVLIDGVATVTEPDITASNGVIHKIDTLLLPEGYYLSFTTTEITENADAFVRVAHFAADAPPVDLYVNGELAVRSLGFTTVTSWLGVREGTLAVAVVPADNSIEEAVLEAELEITEDTWTTVAAVGNIGDDTLALAPFPEDFSAPSQDDFAQATFFNAVTAEGAPFGPIIDFYADGQLLVESIRYPASRGGADGAFSRSLPQGLYDYAITLEDQPQVVLASEPDVPITAERFYLLIAFGDAENTEVTVVETIYEP